MASLVLDLTRDTVKLQSVDAFFRRLLVEPIRLLLAIALSEGLVPVNAEKFPLKNRGIRRRLSLYSAGTSAK
ncbi:hypothetical protein E1I69_02500 [Bacillus timonensis]|uniref:Uncharacterized protein n=1 Tax=Bacillus timonensis TaxID=1033734 RepID=A0A4S3PXT6_9BACI|nr:hypothetical protein [Bacillus timonensis]THE14710.1 hypothetical protein E1I69_02500 [Bacillus timonensis]